MQKVFDSVNFHQYFACNVKYFLYFCIAFLMSHKNKFAQSERGDLLAFFCEIFIVDVYFARL